MLLDEVVMVSALPLDLAAGTADAAARRFLLMRGMLTGTAL